MRKEWMLELMNILLAILLASAIIGLLFVVVYFTQPTADNLEQDLNHIQVADGYNCLAENLRKCYSDQLDRYDFLADPDEVHGSCVPCQTNLRLLHTGRVRIQFFTATASCDTQFKDAVKVILEQIDVIRDLISRNSKYMQLVPVNLFAGNAAVEGKVASLIGVSGGHTIASSLPILRLMSKLGVKFFALNTDCHTLWSDCDLADDPQVIPAKRNGLTDFGRNVVEEMNKLGIILDLSQSSTMTIYDAISTSIAPVMFTHTAAAQLCDHRGNIGDDILRLVGVNGGIVMVTFESQAVACSDNGTIQDVVKHLTHIRNVAGVDHVGIGSAFDCGNKSVAGLEDPSKFPHLMKELFAQNWTVEDIRKVMWYNINRVIHEVDDVSSELIAGYVSFSEALIPRRCVCEKGVADCRSSGQLPHIPDGYCDK